MSELINYSTGTTVPASWLNATQIREEALARYVVYQAGSTWYAKSLLQGGLDYSGSDGMTVAQQAVNGLTAGRTWKEKVVIKGNMDTFLALNGGLRIGILIPSYTAIEIQGTLKLNSGTTVLSGSQNFIFKATNATDIDIIGGEINGNQLGAAPADTRVYGIEFAGSTRVKVRGVYIHDTSETGIAFEGSTTFATAIDNIVYNTGLAQTGQDGIGNDITCSDIAYIGNLVQLGKTELITIEGGNRITVVGNITRDSQTSNGIGVGRLGAASAVTINGNVSYNNASVGIEVFSNATATIVSGNTCYGNIGEGIVVDGVKNSIVGNTVFNNDKNQTSHSGILLTSTASRNMIQGNNCFDNQGTKTQDYGIAILTGSDFNHVLGNNCDANQTGPLLIQAASSSNYVKDNRGFNPQGYAAITPSVPSTGVDQTNASGYPVIVYITGLGSGITAVGITDPAGTLQSFTRTAEVGDFYNVDVGGKIRLSYTGSPTWKWYGL